MLIPWIERAWSLMEQAKMACDAVDNRWDKSDHGSSSSGQTLVKLAESAHRRGAKEEAMRLIELAYARFDADYQDRAEDFTH